MLIIITTISLASAKTFHACDEDAARALKRPWAPVVFPGERETEYLASFANFGPFRAWAGEPHSPGAVSIEVDGRRDRFSLPRVARFPSTSEIMRALRRGGSLWIENAGAADGPARVKILGVVSADCH